MSVVSDITWKDLKARVNLLEVLRQEGFQIPDGRMVALLRCPFHQDGTPSLRVTTTHFTCYAASCGVHGSVLDWMILRHGMNQLEAREELIKIAGGSYSLARMAPVPKAPRIEYALSQVKMDARLQEVCVHYQKGLDGALPYLTSRGITDRKLLEVSKVGFSKGRQRITFPGYIGNTVVNMGTLSVVDTPYPRYLPFEKSRPIAAFMAGDRSARIMGVTEGQIDGLSLAQSKLPTLATSGYNMVPALKLWFEGNQDVNPEAFIIVPDNDKKDRKDGKKPSDVYFEQMKEILQKCRPNAIVSRFEPFGDLKDSNDWLKADPEGFSKAVSQAIQAVEAKLDLLPAA